MGTPRLEDLNASSCSERSIMIHYFDFWRYLKSHYPEDFLWTERLYWYYNNLTEHPTCPVCGKPTKFISLTRGYQEFCSNTCIGKSKDAKERKKQTSIKHYGVENPMHSEEVKNKLKNSNIEKYGVENPFQSEEIKEKIRKVNLERYGVEYPQQSKEIYEKSKRTNLKKYGFEYNSQAQEIKNKKKQTCQEKYGVDNLFQADEFWDQYRKTCIEKYGVDNYSKTEEYKNIMKEQMSEIRKKMAETCMEKYGVDNYSKTEEYKNIMKEQMPEILKKSINTKRQNGTFNTSQIEEDFSNWLTENNINFERQHHDDRYPFNCDFYFPDKDLYLEIQGSWVHGEHPYNPNSRDDQEYLLEMKSKNTDYYNGAIETWTVRDPLKRKTAKKNNLKWVEVFSTNLDDVINVYNKF